MLRYKVLSNNVAEIDLENGYKVVAMANWNNEKKRYFTTLLLHENTVDKWDMLETAANVKTNYSDIKTIKVGSVSVATSATVASINISNLSYTKRININLGIAGERYESSTDDEPAGWYALSEMSWNGWIYRIWLS